MYNKIRLFKKGKIDMIGIYFSGTGNTRYCMEQFVSYYDNTVRDFISEDNLQIKENYQNLLTNDRSVGMINYIIIASMLRSVFDGKRKYKAGNT